MDAAGLIKRTRVRHRLSQEELAVRVGTTQTAISRLERSQRSPTIETLRRLMVAMGEELTLASRPLQGLHDPAHLRAERKLSPGVRLARALDWMRLNAQLAASRRRHQR